LKGREINFKSRQCSLPSITEGDDVSARASIDSLSEFWAIEQSELLSVLCQPKPTTAENDPLLPPGSSFTSA